MKQFITLLLCGLWSIHNLYASDNTSHMCSDSIMRLVIQNASFYEHIFDGYKATIYVKGETQIKKKNFLIHFAHLVFPVEHNPSDAIFEMVSHSEFKTPGNYLHYIEAINSNRLATNKRYLEVLSFASINIYSPTIYNKEIITPVSPQAFRYYNYQLESVCDSTGFKIYNIRFTPRQWSQKLLTGNLYVADKTWAIDKIKMNGHSSFSDFSIQLSFDHKQLYPVLPLKADMQVRFGAFKNQIVCRYHSSFNYKEIHWTEKQAQKENKEPSLDLTHYINLSTDTVPVIRDTTYWNIHRDHPLTADEISVYNTMHITPSKASSDSCSLPSYIRLKEKLTGTINLNNRTTRIKYSGLFNPFQLAFSGKDGVTYRQQVRISKTFADDKQIRFHPEIGYMFKRKEIRFKVSTDWEYLPSHRGTVNFTLANGNQSYSSEIIREINEQIKDLGFSFEDLHLKPFHHYYAQLHHSIEIVNGLQLGSEITYHRRVPREEGFKKKFHDFIPAISLTWTPRQYYWMDGHRKEYLYSHFPTISIEVARGIPGVLESTGNYGRVETSIHQSIRTGLSKRLSYHLSAGGFFNQRSTYFADFHYFAKKYFPDSWNDHQGGVFHNLEGGWYNAADKYIQGHFLYESPFIFIQLLKPAVHKFLLNERFYLSQLWTPALPCYTEVGYGIGSDLFNIACFLGFEKGRYRSLGFKFAFELFQ